MKRNILIFTVLMLGLMLVSSGVIGAPYTPGYNPETIDFEGETMTIVTSWRTEEDFDMDLVEEAEEMFNVNIEIEDTGLAEEQVEHMMTRLMSGDSEYDVWRVTVDQYDQMLGEEAMLPVNSVVSDEYYQDQLEYNEKMINKYSYQGEIYPVGQFEYPITGGTGMIIWNMDMFEEQGLTQIHKLVEDDKWTWDTMREFALQLTSDEDNDGENEQWGLSNAQYQMLVASNDGNFVTEDENGRKRYNFNSSRVVEALDFTTQLLTEDEVAPADDIWGSSQFEDGNAGMAFVEGWLAAFLEDDFRWGVAPLPKGPQGDKYNYAISYSETYVLPLNSEYPEGKVAVMDHIYEREELTPDYIENIIQDYAESRAQTPEIYEMLVETMNDWFGRANIVRPGLSPDSVPETIEEEVLTGERSASEAMEALAGEGQAYLDDLFNN